MLKNTFALHRVRDQTESINDDIKDREGRLGQRLRELEQLQERVQDPEGKGNHLEDVEILIKEWPVLAGDEEAQMELQELVAKVCYLL